MGRCQTTLLHVPKESNPKFQRYENLISRLWKYCTGTSVPVVLPAQLWHTRYIIIRLLYDSSQFERVLTILYWSSYFMSLWPVFGSWPPRCGRFEDSGVLRRKDVVPSPDPVFVWHLIRNPSGMGVPPSSKFATSSFRVNCMLQLGLVTEYKAFVRPSWVGVMDQAGGFPLLLPEEGNEPFVEICSIFWIQDVGRSAESG